MSKDNTLVRETAIPYGWDRVIGRNKKDGIITSFSSESSWFDVSIWNYDGEYTIEVKRGPEHPKQDEIDECLRKQVKIPGDRVETVATAFMMCASDMDPFTNRFTRGIDLD